MADRVAAGKRARRSGAEFERKIVRLLKKHFDDRPWRKDIRRTDQSHYAVQPDVTGVPGLWIECQSAEPKRADPAGKLAQATKDCHGRAIPVAVINRKWGDGSHKIQVYLTLLSLLRVLIATTQCRLSRQLARYPWHEVANAMLCMELDHFLDLYSAGPLSSPGD